MSGNTHPAKKGYTPKGGTFNSRLSGDMGQLKKSNKELLEMALHAHHRIEELRQLLDETRTEFQALLGPVLDNLQQRLDGIEGGAK
jgi:DNA anti-recombination protein RmuC